MIGSPLFPANYLNNLVQGDNWDIQEACGITAYGHRYVLIVIYSVKFVGHNHWLLINLNVSFSGLEFLLQFDVVIVGFTMARHAIYF